MLTRIFGAHKAQTSSEWASILHLATRWEFESIRLLAIKFLEDLPMSSVEKIDLSRKFEIASRWTLTAYAELCARPEALTIQEGRSLGLETAMRISQLREKLRARKDPIRRSTAPMLGQQVLHSPPPMHERCATHRDIRAPSPERTPRRPSAKPPKFSSAERVAAEAFSLDMLLV